MAVHGSIHPNRRTVERFRTRLLLKSKIRNTRHGRTPLGPECHLEAPGLYHSPGFPRTPADLAARTSLRSALASAGGYTEAAAQAVAVADLAGPRRFGAVRNPRWPSRGAARSPRGGAGAGRRAARQVWAHGGGTACGAFDLRTTRDADARAGRGEAAGERAWARGEPPGDGREWVGEGPGSPAGRVGSGARSRTQPPALGHTPGPRAILERAGKRSAVGASALRWGVPEQPTQRFKLRVPGNFPGSSGGGNRNQACGENPHPGDSFVFSASGGVRVFVSPDPP